MVSLFPWRRTLCGPERQWVILVRPEPSPLQVGSRVLLLLLLLPVWLLGKIVIALSRLR